MDRPGTQVAVATHAETPKLLPPPKAPGRPPAPKPRRWWLWAVVLLGLIAAIWLLRALFGGGAPRKTVEAAQPIGVAWATSSWC